MPQISCWHLHAGCVLQPMPFLHPPAGQLIKLGDRITQKFFFFPSGLQIGAGLGVNASGGLPVLPALRKGAQRGFMMAGSVQQA